MRKTLLTISVAIAASAVASATPLTPEEALRAAIGAGRRCAPGIEAISNYSLDWTGVNSGLYVFGRADGGFVVAAGDSEFPALLGYSETARFDAANMPPALSEFLAELDWAISSGNSKALVATKGSKADIAPLVSAKWNQDAPYNNMCPEIREERCLTGCAATAMAQVINYWRFPTNPSGEISYRWSGGGQTLSYDFSEVTFDWENMLDVYDANATEEQNEAVATLMLACGMASKMNYSTSFSGSTDIEAGNGMIDYFGYDRGIRLLFRDFYRIAEWNDMLYDELLAGRPVLYYGFSPVGGHAFVCDGYQDEGGDYFHINWGWGGLSDGYFLINGLNPEYIGLGGSTGGFNIMQSAFFGMQPAGEEVSELYRQMLCFGYFATEKFDYSVGDRILFGHAGGVMRAGFFNMSLETLRVTPGIKLTPADGSEPLYFPATKASNVVAGNAIETFMVDTSDFPAEGAFRVNPAYMIEGEEQWRDMPEETQCKTNMILSVSEGAISIETTEGSDGIIVDEFSVSETVFKADESVTITMSCTSNNLDETVVLTPTLISPEGYIVAQGTAVSFMAVSDESFSTTWETTFGPTPEPGAYMLGLLDARTILVCEPINVTVISDNVDNEFTISNVRFNRQLADAAGNVIEGDQLNASCKLTLESGYFDGAVTAQIYDASGAAYAYLAEPTALTLAPGSSKTLSFKGSLSGLDPTADYGLGFVAINADGTETLVGDIYPFTAPDAVSAVAEILGEGNGEARYFNLQGHAVANPKKGELLIRIACGKAMKVRI